MDEAEKLNVIINEVCKYFKITSNDLNKKVRKRNILFPRQISHFLSYKHTKLSLAVIGYNIGGKDHATVLYSYNTILNELSYNKTTVKIISELENNLEFISVGKIIEIKFKNYKEIRHYNNSFLKKY